MYRRRKRRAAPRNQRQLPAVEAGNIKTEARRNTMRKWRRRLRETDKGEWTRRLVSDLDKWVARGHGQMNFHLTQAMSGHGGFNKFLYRIQRAPSLRCSHCKSEEEDDAEHTLFSCTAWSELRNALVVAIGEYSPATMVKKMLESSEKWQLVEAFVHEVMQKKEEDECRRQRQPLTGSRLTGDAEAETEAAPARLPGVWYLDDSDSEG